MRRRTLEEKLEAIRLVEEGNSPRSVSDRLHIGHHQILSGYTFIKKKESPGLKTSVYVRKTSIHLKKDAKLFVNIKNLS